jgi:hypothetical protein
MNVELTKLPQKIELLSIYLNTLNQDLEEQIKPNLEKILKPVGAESSKK